MPTLDGVDIIYWINMDRSTDRRVYMEELLADPAFQDIPKERISAIDGKKDPEFVLQSYVMKRQDDRTSVVEYACLLSHLETIRKFAESPQKTGDVALILEDDTSLDFKPYWTKSIREIMDSAPKDWDIILLSYMTPREKIPTDDFTLAYGNHFSTAAYLINRKSAQKFTADTYQWDRKYHLTDEPRHVADEYIYNKTRAYTYKHPYFIYKANNDTTLLHDRSMDFHERSRVDIEEVLYDKKPCNMWWLVLALIAILLLVVFVMLLSVMFFPSRFTRKIVKLAKRLKLT